MINKLKMLLSKIQSADSYREKNAILKEFVSPSLEKEWIFEGQPEEVQYVLNSVVAIGQGPVVFNGYEVGGQFDSLIKVLLEVEQFYDGIGGVIGYHCKVLELINAQEEKLGEANYLQPTGTNLSEETQEVRDAVRWGIEALPEMAEIYPVGGAGDRLSLVDEETGEALPAAQLQFLGRSLLEGMIRDLEAREYLHYKLTGNRVVTPIAMMTSQEKNNEQHILEIIEESGRDKNNIITFQQPLVPVITVEGNWSMQAPLQPTLKPGGHGVIWKLAKDKGVFNWLKEKGRDKALLRQINNPVAGTDLGLLAFTGIGCHEKKAFGFASCNRRLNTAEGMNVVVEKEGEYTLSNIEYTEFKQKGIEDAPATPGSSFSKFPANTNILFADLNEVENALKKCSIPGMLINLKNKAPYRSPDGKVRQVPAGRLETTMQNISDYITSPSLDDLKSYLTYNDRRKTISVTKKSFVSGKSPLETPVGCFEELMENNRDLLENYCGFNVSEGCIFIYHPALGPLYKVIAQKLRKGTLHKNSELQLEIAEADIEELSLDGSLVVNAELPLEGRCTLHNITVKNEGIDQEADNTFWKNEIKRNEAFVIEIQGNGEFVANDLTFTGDYYITVPSGHRITAYSEGDTIQFKKEKITKPTWSWTYSFDDKNNINLAQRS